MPWAMWHTAIAGPTNDNFVDWDNWYLKSRNTLLTNKFLLSPDCNSCEIDHKRQSFGSKSTYWMSGNLFGCYWMTLGKHNCDMDKDTYACYDCSQSSDPTANGDAVEITEDDDPSVYYYTGQCATAVRSSESQITASHETCQLGLHFQVGDIVGDAYELDYETDNIVQYGADSTTARRRGLGGGYGDDGVNDLTNDDPASAQFDGEIWKPSLGTDGRFCVCSQTMQTSYNSVTKDELKQIMQEHGDDYDTFHQFNQNSNNNGLKISNNIESDQGIEDVEDIEEEEESSRTSKNSFKRLYAKHFEAGTYRITQPGTYVLMEDVELEFNKGSLGMLNVVLFIFCFCF